MAEELFFRAEIALTDVTGTEITGTMVIPKNYSGNNRVADYVNESKKQFLLLLNAMAGDGKKTPTLLVNKDHIVRLREEQARQSGQ